MTRPLALVDSYGEHDPNRVHAFGHTGGACPKCGCREFMRRFCAPARGEGIRGCEADGEHVHFLCGGCQYTFAERCRDVGEAASEHDEVTVEGEGSAFLCAMARRANGLRFSKAEIESCMGWRLARTLEDESIVVTAAPPDPADLTKPAPLTVEDGAPQGTRKK